MNIRLFSMAVLVSALPLFASAGSSQISLDKGDFISAQRVSRNGETIINVKLSKSGKSKFKKLNASAVNKEVHSEIGGVESNFKLREPITGEKLEMGPYSVKDAEKVIAEINKN